MAKAERRQKMETEKIKRQKERIENRLRIKSQQAQMAEKKLKEMMTKKQNAQVSAFLQKMISTGAHLTSFTRPRDCVKIDRIQFMM